MAAPVSVAERLYYADSDVLEFEAEVTEVRELARVEGKPVFQLALQRTAFYPTGGGQPFDTGVLIATARSGATLDAVVTDVTEDESGEVWHTTEKPLQPGTVVAGRVDAFGRRDDMQQHTGQHLISAVAWRAMGLRTVGFHLGPVVSTVDLTAPSLSSEELAKLTDLVNDTVMQALPVWQRMVSRDEAERLLATGVLPKLPERDGSLRVVSMGATGAELDQNACGGTHVQNTAAIGPVLLRRTERVRGNTRVTFVCGGRALQAVQADAKLLQELASALSVGTPQLLDRVSKMQAEIRAMRREQKAGSQG